MAEFGLDIAPEVMAACQQGAAEAAEAIGRAFDGTFELAPGESATLDFGALPEGLAGPGLVLILKGDSGAAVAALAESSGLVPKWVSEPDAGGVSKLATLAQELGAVLLPEEHMPTSFEAARVDELSDVLKRGGVADGAAAAPLELSSGETRGILYLVWPATSPDGILSPGASAAAPEEASAGETPPPQGGPEIDDATEDDSSPEADADPRSQILRGRFANIGEGLHLLPQYARSLLKIKVPVVVRLASTKQPVRRIVDLGPGSIIQFNKRCEETLTLEVGGYDVAEGEAIKVSDKFGLRITSVTLPDEKFLSVRGQRDS